MNEEDVLQYSIAVANVSMNVNGGYHRNGVAKPLVEKLNVAANWIEMSNESGNHPSIKAFTRAANVSRDFATKVVNELRDGQIIDPKSLVRNIPRGKGSRSITDDDGSILLRL